MAGIAFDFFPKAPDVDVDGSGGDEGSFLPHRVEQLIPCEDATAMVSQVFQQAEFAYGGEDIATLHLDSHRTDVNFEVAKAKHLGGRGFLVQSTQHAANPGHQFARAERLGDVVVAAEFKPLDAVGFAGLGGQKDDGSRREGWGLADMAAEFEAV